MSRVLNVLWKYALILPLPIDPHFVPCRRRRRCRPCCATAPTHSSCSSTTAGEVAAGGRDRAPKMCPWGMRHQHCRWHWAHRCGRQAVAQPNSFIPTDSCTILEALLCCHNHRYTIEVEIHDGCAAHAACAVVRFHFALPAWVPCCVSAHMSVLSCLAWPGLPCLACLPAPNAPPPCQRVAFLLAHLSTGPTTRSRTGTT